MLNSFDAETETLVQLAAVLAAGRESAIRDALAAAARAVRHEWVEELILQTYLFAGFPRALNAAREWRRISGDSAPLGDEGVEYDAERWQERGVETCAAVYGELYDRLRDNIRALHPALDAWMIVEGYGKTLGRPALDLARRELCIVAACAAAGQDRQLHSHLHGALNVGVAPDVVTAVLASLSASMTPGDGARYLALWAKVQAR